MSSDKQKLVQERFERMFQKGHKPWREHAVENLFHNFLHLLSQEIPNAKLLDIGCGDGWAAILAAQKGFEVWGIDSSPTGIKEAINASKKAQIKKQIHFITGDALDLHYESSFFDAIIDGGLFHHIIPTNRNLYMDNLIRVLKPTGYLYLSAFSSNSKNEVGYHFTQNDIKDIFGQRFSVLAFEEDEIESDSPFISSHYIMRRK